MADLGGGAVPTYDVCHGNDNWFGGNGMIVFFLFFLLAWGGGFGNGFGRNDAMAQYATQQDIVNGFNFNQLDNGIRGLERGVCQLGYDNLAQTNGVNTNIMQSAYGITNAINTQGYQNQTAINQLGYQMQNCCCENLRAADSIKFENAQNTCAITNNATANTQRILDRLCQMEANAKDEQISQLRFELQSANLQLGNLSQTANIINAVRPFPTPSYQVSSPYGTNYPNCGCGCGC